MQRTPRLIDKGETGGDDSPVTAPGRRDRILVWDVAVRVFHWLLVAGVAVAWLSGGTGHRVHETVGFAVAGLLAFRFVWGVMGTPHARFSDFVHAPRTLRTYLADLASGRAARHLGHNPAGGYMIVAMLACLTIISLTGAMQLTNRFFGLSWVETLHHRASDGFLLLVPLHLAGVVASSLMHRENLVAAMLTGLKPRMDAPTHAGRIEPPHQALEARLLGNLGFTLLVAAVVGGLFIGWNSTSQRTAVSVAEPPTSVETRAVSRAAQDSAAALDKGRQDYVSGGPQDVSQTWLLASGGRLYDNWFAALGKQGPQQTHPSWPATNTSLKGEATWRCKSCHGWDYRGRDGEYRTGAAATGIKGLARARGRDVASIMAILANDKHGFTDDLLPEHAKYRLALFLSQGQHNASRYINESGGSHGDIELGKPLFQSICASCHGFDGRARKLGLSAAPASSGYSGPPLFVGTKARSGPAEVLHKIRNGHPGAVMVAMRPFSMEVATNLLAYAQTLPTQ